MYFASFKLVHMIVVQFSMSFVIRLLFVSSLFIISHPLAFVKRFFELFCSVGRFCFTSPNYALGRGCSLLSASWHPYCSTLNSVCQEVFLRSWNFFILYFCGQCAPCWSLQQSVLSEEMATCHTPSGKYLISSPLDNYSIAFREYFVNSFFQFFPQIFSLAL